MLNIYKATTIKELVTSSVAQMEVAPKNQTRDIQMMALGGLDIAHQLGVISGTDKVAAVMHIEAAARLRQMRNNGDTSRYESEAVKCKNAFYEAWE